MTWDDFMIHDVNNPKLGVVYIMDHEAVSRPCKICDWLLNSSQDQFGFHQGKKMSK